VKRLIAALLVAVMPLQAWGDTAPSSCDATETFAGNLDAGLSELRTAVARDGWCAIENTELAVFGVQISDAAFRVDQLPIAPAGARSLEVTIDRLETDLGAFTLSAALSYMAETGALTLHELSLRGADGRRLKAVANLSAASSLTDLKVEGVLAQLFVTPAFLRETGIDFADLSRAHVNDALRDVDEAQVSRRARNEFLRFAGAAPDAQGALNVRIDMAEALPVGQLAAPFLSLGRDPETQAIARAFAAGLAGVSIDIAWNPGRM
jgi:hypothetical protein